MKYIKKVILFFINTIWYLNVITFPFTKWILSLVCVYNLCIWLMAVKEDGSNAGLLALFTFLLLTGLLMFNNEYKP